MRHEQACCAFLTFEMHKEPDAVTLTTKAPKEAQATVEALFEAFLPAKGQTRREPATAAPRGRWTAWLVDRVDLPRRGDQRRQGPRQAAGICDPSCRLGV